MRIAVAVLLLATVAEAEPPERHELRSLRLQRVVDATDRKHDKDDESLAFAQSRASSCYGKAIDKHGRFVGSFDLELAVDNHGKAKATPTSGELAKALVTARSCVLLELDKTTFPAGPARKFRVRVTMQFK